MPYPRTHVAMRKIDWGGAGQIPEALGQDRTGSFLSINRYFFSWIKFATELVRTMDESLRLRGRRLSLLKLMRKEKTSDITHRPGEANRSNCKH
jgi:hypothetical protein